MDKSLIQRRFNINNHSCMFKCLHIFLGFSESSYCSDKNNLVVRPSCNDISMKPY